MVIWLQELGMQLLIWLLGLLDSIFSVFSAAAGITDVNTPASGSEGISLGTYFLQLDGVQKAFWVIFIVSIAICAVCTVAAVVKAVVNLNGGERKSHAKIAGQALGSIFVTLAMAAMLTVGVTASDKLLGIVNNEINGGEPFIMGREILNVSIANAYPLDTENVQGLNEYDKDGNCTYIAYLYRYKLKPEGTPAYYIGEYLPDNCAVRDYVVFQRKAGDGYADYAFTEIYSPTQETDESGKTIYKVTDFGKLELQPATDGWCVKGERNGETVYYSKEDITNIWEETPQKLLGSYRSALGFPTSWRNNGMFKADSFNFLIAYLSTVIVLVAVVGATLGLIKRLFDLVLLFLALPAISATIPLDDGAKFKLWRETVITKVMLAFGSVLAVNIFAIVAPTLWNVSLFGESSLTNKILRMLLICGGALTISGGQLLFARLVGGDASESRDMAQSARTLFAGAHTASGIGKATGRLAFGQKNANGQRVGGLVKTGAGLVGSVGGGFINTVGTATGGYTYRNSKLARGATAVQQALKGFSHSTGWSGEGTAGGMVGSALGKVGGQIKKACLDTSYTRKRDKFLARQGEQQDAAYKKRMIAVNAPSEADRYSADTAERARRKAAFHDKKSSKE